MSQFSWAGCVRRLPPRAPDSFSSIEATPIMGGGFPARGQHPYMGGFWQRCLAALIAGALVLAMDGCAQQLAGPPSFYDEMGLPEQVAYQPAQQTAEQLQQLVAPIALYPDALVAQILAASTYPTEIVEAHRWIQEHPDLQGSTLAQAVAQQPWDPSVKALTQFPAVLASMDNNLAWTSALGEAYVDQPQDVLNAVQTMRRRAMQAGNLESNAQQTVTVQGQTISIEPASLGTVYLPAYDPWLVYGTPLAAYPGWVGVPGVFVAEPGVYFGVGFGIGYLAGFGWGWPAWSFDWDHDRLIYRHAPYLSHSRTFRHHHFVHGGFVAGGFERPHFEHGEFEHHGFEHGEGFERHEFEHPGFEHGEFGFGSRPPHVSAFSGFGQGARVSNYSARGHYSFGGGFHGGGFRGSPAGGFGGFHGGEGRR
jgi:hypothetical protein